MIETQRMLVPLYFLWQDYNQPEIYRHLLTFHYQIDKVTIRYLRRTQPKQALFLFFTF